jgi:hypothetical protein
MPRDLEAYAIQFLSRDTVPDDFDGHYDGVPFEGAPFSLSFRIQKGGLESRQATSRSWARGRTPKRPLIATPWPTRLDVGAVQHVDPYFEMRWPAYLRLFGNIRVFRDGELSEEELAKFCGEIRHVLWGSFDSMGRPEIFVDQRMWYKGYRWRYFSGSTDLHGNPCPNPKGKYVLNYKGAPTGPGFVNIPIIRPVASLPYTSLSEVWSQGFSVPKGATEKAAEKRAR